MRIDRYTVALVAVTALAVTVGSGALLAEARGAAAPRAAAGGSERAILGLSTSASTLRRLGGAGVDVGTRRWGVAMTAAEEAKVDLGRRVAFAAALHSELIPYVRSRPEYAGGFLDQRRDGRLVLFLTRTDAAIEAAVRAATPAGGRVEVRLARHSYAELERAVTAVWQRWGAVNPGIPLLSAAIDSAANGIRVDVDGADVRSVTARLRELGRAVGVPVSVAAATPAFDAACDIKTGCDDRVRPGSLVRAGSQRRGFACAMGFHVVAPGNDRQFLTAGHCGKAASSRWVHSRLGQLGYEQATVWRPNGVDAMRVQLPDRSASERIARYTRPIFRS